MTYRLLQWRGREVWAVESNGDEKTTGAFGPLCRNHFKRWQEILNGEKIYFKALDHIVAGTRYKGWRQLSEIIIHNPVVVSVMNERREEFKQWPPKRRGRGRPVKENSRSQRRVRLG